MKLGNFYLHKKDTKTAIKYYHRLIPGLITNRDYSNLGLVYYKLARIAKLRNNYSEAIILGQKSIGIYEMAADKRTMTDALNFLGVLYGDMGFAEKSYQYHLRALNLAEEQKNYQAMAIMLVNLSGIRGPAHASEYLYRALETIRNVKDDTARGYVYNTLGLYFLGTGKYDSALYYFEVSLAIRKAAREYQGISFTLNNMGEVYFLRDNMGSALRYYNEGLAVAISIKDPLSMCVSYGSLANYYKKNGNDRQSYLMLLKNLELSKRIQLKAEELNGLKNIADYYEKTDQPREALKYFRQYDSLKDTLVEEKRQRAVTEFQTRYEMSIKEKEILKLQSDNKIKTVSIQRTRIIIVAMITVLIIFALSGWFMIRSYRDKLTAYKELVRRDIEIIKAENTGQEKKITILPAIREQISASAPASKSMGQNLIPDELQEKLYNELLHIMKNEKRFLDPSLTLADVAKELNTNTSYLSRIINDQAEQNFSQFLNEYRIREARRLLADTEYRNLSIQGIAQTVGFNSKSAFNSAFKAKTGVTPSFYQQSAKQINSPELPAEKLPSGLEGKNYAG